MRTTAAQREGRDALRAAAPGFRVLRDLEGWPFVPGRRHAVPDAGDVNGRGYDRLEWIGGPEPFAVYVAARRLAFRLAPLLAIPGVRRVQLGEREARCAVAPEAIPAVLTAIKARRKRRSRPGISPGGAPGPLPAPGDALAPAEG